MNLNLSSKLALPLGLLLSAHPRLHAQPDHGHLNVGALGKNQNDRLIWVNGADFITSSGYVKTLDYTNSGRYAGFFQGGITLTVLPATAEHAGPDPQAPALGSHIQFRMACLEGPEGGTFNFWESTGSAPAESLAPGQAGTNLWVLSENDGSPGLDPYGHIHGRRFTATQAGLYKIGFTAVDTSTNGTGEGPIHTDSERVAVWFQAGVNIEEIEPDFEEGHVHVRFGARAGFTWQLEASSSPDPQSDWAPAGDPVVGSDVFVEVVHEGAPGAERYYRLKGTPVSP